MGIYHDARPYKRQICSKHFFSIVKPTRCPTFSNLFYFVVYFVFLPSMGIYHDARPYKRQICSKQLHVSLILLFSLAKSSVANPVTFRQCAVTTVSNNYVAVGTAQSVQWLDYGLDNTGVVSRQGQGMLPLPPSLERPDRLWGSSSLLLNGCRGVLSAGVKRSESEVNR